MLSKREKPIINKKSKALVVSNDDADFKIYKKVSVEEKRDTSADESITITIDDEEMARSLATEMERRELEKKYAIGANADTARILIAELYTLRAKGWNWEFSTDTLYQVRFTIPYDEHTADIELGFNEALYPWYPPTITMVRPYCGSFNVKIANLRLVRLKYWNPTRSVQNILEILQSILVGNAGQLKKSGGKALNSANTELLTELTKLTALTDTDFVIDDLDSNEYPLVPYHKDKEVTIKKGHGEVAPKFTKGTGYGNNGSVQWDIGKWALSQKEKRDKLAVTLGKIAEMLPAMLSSKHSKVTIGLLQTVDLLEYICTVLKEVPLSLLEKEVSIYEPVLQIMSAILESKCDADIKKVQDSMSLFVDCLQIKDSLPAGMATIVQAIVVSLGKRCELIDDEKEDSEKAEDP
jgi:ubiquitin-protein ligase